MLSLGSTHPSSLSLSGDGLGCHPGQVGDTISMGFFFFPVRSPSSWGGIFLLGLFRDVYSSSPGLGYSVPARWTWSLVQRLVFCVQGSFLVPCGFRVL